MTAPDVYAAWLENRARTTVGGDADRLMAIAAALRECAAERDAYKRAKAENDDRYMLERDTARRERDEAVALGRELAEALDDECEYHNESHRCECNSCHALDKARAADWR